MLATALLLLHAVLAVGSLRSASPTFDEVSHLPAGLAVAATGDVWLNPQHPPLVKELAGLAAGTLRPRLPLAGAAYRAGDQWGFGREVLYLAGNDPMALVRAGRLPVVAMSLLAAVVCFVWGRKRYGDVGGLLALALYAGSPTILAHATLVTTDVPATLGMLATFWLWWRATRGTARTEVARATDGADPGGGPPSPPVDLRSSLLPWVLCGVALGVALASKFSALLLPPMMLACDMIANGRRDLRRRLVGYAVTGAAAIVVVQATYLSLAAPLRYLHDTGLVYGTTSRAYLYYLAGAFAPRFPHYFLVATAVKATPAELLAMAGALVAAWLRRERWRDDLYLWLPALGWFAAMSWLAVDIGVRYVLPAWAMLFVLAGALAPELLRRTRLLARPGRLGPALLVALAVTQVGEAAFSFPGYISYANRLAGGRARVTRWLDDSNVDWGQSFYRLPGWLAQRGIDHARVLPMGSATVPMQDSGVRLEGMLASDWGAPRPGAYVISAHQLVRGLERARSGTPTDWLRRYEPTDTFDGSMFLYVFPPPGSTAGGPDAGATMPPRTE